MKKLVALLVVLSLCLVGCSVKSSKAIKIKNDSVTSVTFKKTYFSDTDPDGRSYMAKSVTEKADVDALCNWLSGMSLEKQNAIEIPVEQVQYVIILNGKAKHTVIFLDDYVVYDTTAYTYNKSKKTEVTDKYNLLNYEEQQTELGLI